MSVLLAACQTAGEYEAEIDRADHQRCLQYGAETGTSAYIRCRTDLERNRAIAAANRQPVIIQRPTYEVERVYVREPRPVFFPPQPQPYPQPRPPVSWQPPPQPYPPMQPPGVGPRPPPPFGGPVQPGVVGPTFGGPPVTAPPPGSPGGSRPGILPLCATVPPGTPCRAN